MNIRDATIEDNQELQELQAKCPQGKTLIVSLVNTPDFFARAKAYGSYKVYVAYEDNQIIGSAACGCVKPSSMVTSDESDTNFNISLPLTTGERVSLSNFTNRLKIT